MMIILKFEQDEACVYSPKCKYGKMLRYPKI